MKLKYGEIKLDLQVIRNSYIRFMEQRNYPAELVNRRAFTYQRFIDHHETLDSVSLKEFYDNNDFLRPHSHCLVLMDLLAWLRFMENEKLIDQRMYLDLDRRMEEVM
ncbi:MAG: hypothetical protein KDD94_08555 [Calditrichaeota bacterium]|nr:hypothetical protein [Calditrichota bacterium]